MHRSIGQPELLKEINLAHIFIALKRAGMISRAQLAKQTGLSRATVSTLADELLRVGIAQEIGLGNSTGGRPPVLLQFNPTAALALGARMRDHEWGIIASDLAGTIVHRLNYRIEGGRPEDAVAALAAGVTQLVAQIGQDRVLPAIGLGTPGLVDVRSGVIKTAVDVGWFDVPIRQMVEEALGLRVFVANRSKVGALAERLYGTGKDVQNLIYISIGTGVVAGIVHRGELYLGANSSAGEVGHVTVLPDGPLCPCGNRGCLQQLASGPAIAARARAELRAGQPSTLTAVVGDHPEWLTAEMVFAAAAHQDALACAVVEEVATYLGIAIANLINLFNPELIILGGPVGHTGDALLVPLWREIQRRAMAYPLSATRLITSSLGQDTGAVGAAALVLQQTPQLFFTDAAGNGQRLRP